MFSTLKKKLFEKVNLVHKLRLSWCKCQPHKGEKLGGWAHENFLGMARILPWAHEEITTFDEVDECHEPDLPVSRWMVNQRKNFLKRHQKI